MDLLEKRYSDYKKCTYPNINNGPDLLKIKSRDE